jgi:hypothetical protein
MFKNEESIDLNISDKIRCIYSQIWNKSSLNFPITYKSRHINQKQIRLSKGT